MDSSLDAASGSTGVSPVSPEDTGRRPVLRSGVAGPSGDELLARLEDLLTQQVQSAQRQDYDAVLALGQRLDELLDRLRTSALPTMPDWPQRLARIKQLHQQLGLMLTLDRQELAGQLALCRQGRGVLEAYGRSLGG